MSFTQQQKQPVVIAHLVGEENSGKSTLARLLLQLPLRVQKLLLVLTDADTALLKHYGHQPQFLAPQLLENPPNVGINPKMESLDWLVQEYVLDTGEAVGQCQRDLLPLGPTQASQLEPGGVLAMALPRLMAQYDLVVVDGDLPSITALLPAGSQERWLVLMTPQATPQSIQAVLQEADLLAENNVDLIFSPANATQALPAFVRERIQQQDWHLVGRIPPVSQPLPDAENDVEADLAPIHEAFYDCLSRLDWPVAFFPLLTEADNS